MTYGTSTPVKALRATAREIGRPPTAAEYDRWRKRAKRNGKKDKEGDA